MTPSSRRCGLSESLRLRKYQPDKAIDLIDEAGSRAHLSTYTRPEAFSESENRVSELIRPQGRGGQEPGVRDCAQLRDEIKAEKEHLADLQKRWKNREKGKGHPDRR